jgi:hypothetical protein
MDLSAADQRMLQGYGRELAKADRRWQGYWRITLAVGFVACLCVGVLDLGRAVKVGKRSGVSPWTGMIFSTPEEGARLSKNDVFAKHDAAVGAMRDVTGAGTSFVCCILLALALLDAQRETRIRHLVTTLAARLRAMGGLPELPKPTSSPAAPKAQASG